MTARYLLCPGLVTSMKDGQRHHVSASQLAMLYGVSMADCLVLPASANSVDRLLERRRLVRRAMSGELTLLVPLDGGDYRLPEASK